MRVRLEQLAAGSTLLFIFFQLFSSLPFHSHPEQNRRQVKTLSSREIRLLGGDLLVFFVQCNNKFESYIGFT